MRFTLPGDAIPDEAAFPVLKAALDSGANVWNAADFYGTPENNSLHLLQRYFSQYPSDAERVVLSVKSGVADMRTFSMDSSPAAIRQSVDRANAILAGTKRIDLFGPGRVDPHVPIEETVAALKELVEEGKIGGIQLSEVHSNTIIRAHAVAKVDMVEAEISLWATDVFENGVAKTCAELGIVMEAHTPLGAGMLTGRIRSPEDIPPHDYHRRFPRFQPENLPTNLQLVEKVKEVAKVKECTPAQLALSWLRTRSGAGEWPTIIPLPGARAVERVRENNTHVPLSQGDMGQLDDILRRFPVAGDRYPAAAAKLTEY
ncbi:NADP-dependent oxidoreductase domain-containing protein [Aspergillus caelatus]|uniref:NADP-dependent oxidoreductase domain-containing protein n=1 Tax=Aspergillus caelatus TaxID=61420 RepID=A0A5N6ZKL9_9EURO|nr:NADP-dependent oxidoreductase domain-containing protein [Aspergillus caelatus]KAE8358174.1 NADP-dependent oxidoreductase domain-containing protein [Aspergillus caelatus]